LDQLSLENEYGNLFGKLYLEASANAIKTSVPGVRRLFKTASSEILDKIFKYNGRNDMKLFPKSQAKILETIL
jgi:hypothetical protein